MLPCKGMGYRPIVLSDIRGFSLPLWEPQMTCNCVGSERVAIERLFTDYPPATDAAISQYWKVLRRLPRIPLRRLTSGELLGYYTGMKKRRYERAVVSLEAEPLDLHRDSRLKCFAKVEPFNPEKGTAKARIVLYRSFRFNFELMRYTKPVEQFLWRMRTPKWVSPHGFRMFIRGLSRTAQAELLRAKWETFGQPLSISLDCKKFDAHVQDWQLAANHWFVNQFYGERELADLLKVTRKLRFRDSGGQEYKLRGRRATGDVTTALGNSLISAVMAMTALRDVSHYELSVDGDDVLLFIESSDRHKFDPEVWKTFGHECTYHFSETFEGIEVCQAQPVHTVNGWQLVRDYRKALATLAMGYQYTPGRGQLRHAGTVLRTTALEFAGVPLLGPIIACLSLQYPERDLPLPPWERERRLAERGKSSVITPEARTSFARAFGVDPASQEWHERIARSWKRPLAWETKYQFSSNNAGALIRVQ